MSSGSPIDDIWYLDTVASNHMTGMKTLYHSLYESNKRVVRFGDGYLIRYEVKGKVHIYCTDSERMIFDNIFYIPKSKTNILSLGKLDSQGCGICLKMIFLLFMMGKGVCLPRLPRQKGIDIY